MTLHAIERAKEHYKLELTFDDLRFILNEILEDRAKEIIYPNMFDYKHTEIKTYHIRYKNKLIEPVVRHDIGKVVIVTFLPTGKRANRYLQKWLKRNQDENYKHLMRSKGKRDGNI